MKKTACHIPFALVWACFWVIGTGRMSAAGREYVITYTDLSASWAMSGEVNFTSGTHQGGSIGIDAVIWTGPTRSLVNLQPTNSIYSSVIAGAGNQQVGFANSGPLFVTQAAVWNGTASSYRNLNPSWSSASVAHATSGTQQVGFATAPGFQVHAVLWSGTASSAVDLHPGAGADSSTAWAIAGGQQGGEVNYNGIPHAALWSSTAASYRDLHPRGWEFSEIRAMTTDQQVGRAGWHAGIWFGTAESFVDIHPAGAIFSVARATIGTMQSGFALFDTYNHAFLWFGSATNYLDLHPALGSQYRASEAHCVWSDGSTILVGGLATDWPGYSHPILWSIPVPCAITCPTNLVVCADPRQCGAVVQYAAPLATNCAGLNIESTPSSGSFFPIGTNLVTYVAKDSEGHVVDTCTFQVVVRDCEPPVVHNVAASPAVLWPPNGTMQPITVRVSGSDNCGSTRSRILSVTSNEPTNVDGGGHRAPDWEITGDLTLNLRAERAGTGTGRVYTITVQSTDDSGNNSTALAHVTVPHSGSDDSKIAGPKPALTIKHAGPQLVVSWPTNYAGFTLESSPNPTFTTSTDCANSTFIFSGQCWVTNSLSPSTRFFRLRK
jgi:hypothetical protein